MSMEDLEDLDASQDLFSQSWRGTCLKNIRRMDKVPGSELRTGPNEDRWDERHVRMPCSKECFQPIRNPRDGTKELRLKWTLIQKSLSQRISSGPELEKAIFQYNLGGRWNFDGLTSVFKDEDYLSEEEVEYFFESILPGIQDLCLQLPQLLLFPIPLLKKQGKQSITLSQTQISSLLANAFFCTFPRRNTTSKGSEYINYPNINFSRLYEPFSSPNQAHKLKCIFNYFRRRLTKSVSNGFVTFSRRSLRASECPDWAASGSLLPRLHINSTGNIESDGHGLLQVDFANSMIGGGVLGHGCVQEEIRFLICPELIAARLFVERLENNECLVMSGFERYSNYRGYASTFEFTDNHEDQTPFDESNNHRKTLLVAIDALKFKDSEEQFREENIKRELNKAFVGFYPHEPRDSEPSGIATGNWGCGAFGGDPQLKFLIQLMAAGEAQQRDVSYFTFGDEALRDTLYSTYQNLVSHKVTIGDLYFQILQYSSSEMFKEKDLLEYINESFSFDHSEIKSSVVLDMDEDED